MSAQSVITIRNLDKTYQSSQGAVHAVRSIDLDVSENSFVVLLGPSGCGKTTTLRCVAGLEKPDGGTIEIDGEVVNRAADGTFVPPENRNIGMVFQSYAVWPHLNVFDNLALPLTDGKTRVPRDEVRDRVMESLRLVRMQGYEKRSVTELSGGQQQRVALARAVVRRPRVLLMDEPLSNLDARLREEMRLELKAIASSIGVTTLYVTHDQAEALSLGDRICVMKDGEIQQMGSPEEVYSSPPNLFVAEFVGEMNFIPGSVAGPGQVDSPLGLRSYDLPASCGRGDSVTLAIRPHHLDLAAADEANAGLPEGTVTAKAYLGDAALFELDVCGVTLQVKLPGDSPFQVGQRARVVLPDIGWHVYS